MGHCLKGSDAGAEGNGRKEQDCTREIGYKVKSKLEALGHSVIICSCDTANSTAESLQYRVNTANKNSGDIYVSIHLNAGGGYGTEIFTNGAKPHIEAIRTLNELISLGFKNRGIKDGSSLFVIKNTKIKAILIECCFIDTSDMQKYNAENFANAITKGITGQTVAVNVDQNILELQKLLNKFGATDQNGQALRVDGIIGPKTRVALSNLTKKI